jgi:hypothetical protein
MFYLNYSSVLIFVICSSLLGRTALAESESFIYGINGHPGMQRVYDHVGAAKQMDLIKDLGLNWYRINLTEKFFTVNRPKFNEVLEQAKKSSIKLLPILVPDININDSLSDLYTKSFVYGKKVAEFGANTISHFELLNERDIPCMKLVGVSPGNLPSHYDQTCMTRVVSMINGLHNGVKSVNKNYKTLVGNAGWKHYGFFKKLEELGVVKYDILATHWYSNMSDEVWRDEVYPALASNKKDIWITEYNRLDGSILRKVKLTSSGEPELDVNGNPVYAIAAYKDVEQGNYIRRFSLSARRYTQVKALFIYTLLDDPDLNAHEANYGLVKIKKEVLTKKWLFDSKKIAFKVVQNLAKSSNELDIIESDGVKNLFNTFFYREPDTSAKKYYTSYLRAHHYFELQPWVRLSKEGCTKAAPLFAEKYFGRSPGVSELIQIKLDCQSLPFATVENKFRLSSSPVVLALGTNSYNEIIGSRIENEIRFLARQSSIDLLTKQIISRVLVPFGKSIPEYSWASIYNQYALVSPAVLSSQINHIYLQYMGRTATNYEIEFWSGYMISSDLSFLTLREKIILESTKFLNALPWQ